MQKPLILLLTAFLVSTSGSTLADTLFQTNAVWRFLPGTNEASSPVHAWRAPSFDDSRWTTSPAPIFYGEPLTPGTLLPSMANAYSSFFVRRTFIVTNTAELTAFVLRAAVDDGFIAWINGTEVASQNPPTNLAYNAFASAFSLDPPPFVDFLLPPPSSYVQPGTNALAIQVFNRNIDSSDIVFDAALLVEKVNTNTLAILSRTPTPGIVSNLTSVRIVFSHLVTSVRAADLLLNGTAATGLSGSGSTYTFTFPQPRPGTITISWDPLNSIITTANPVQRFLPSGPDSSWTYELPDFAPPLLASRFPIAWANLRTCAEVEVAFDKPVTGVDASDLLVNSLPATNVAGVGAGPYLFQFPQPNAGNVILSFAPQHGIQSASLSPQPFTGSSWTLLLNPTLPIPNIVLNEILAENFSGLRDEDNDLTSWIELHNRTSLQVNLEGWSLTDDPALPAQWVFPAVSVPPKGYLLICASGKDRRSTTPPNLLHANFKLSPNGEFLGLFSPDSPRLPVDVLNPAYPEQAADHSYGRTTNNTWLHLVNPSPGALNDSLTANGRVQPVHFSADSGFYPYYLTTPLSLDCPTPGAVIRYTVDASEPTEINGKVYTKPTVLRRIPVVRAVAHKKGMLPSPVTTRTYLYTDVPSRDRTLPALSIVTARSNLYGPTGIMEPPNPQYHGIAWERPATVELFNTPDGRGFTINCGIRVAGGDYIRPNYDYRSPNLPFNKYSFRLYFRGDYGPGRLNYPWFPTTTLDSFDRITLRAGMNDPINPFLRDEFIRRLEANVGVVASHGTFVQLYVNGSPFGTYNPAEYIDETFLGDYHATTNLWDLVDQTIAWGQAREGDSVAWNEFRSFVNSSADLSTPTNYLKLNRLVDLTNYVEYLLPLLYADVDDWPHNNWRAARERSPSGRFRFLAWDAEFSFGSHSGGVNHNTIAGQLSSLNPPWGSTVIQEMFNRIKVLPEFKLLFADRVHKHLFNGGPLTDASISTTYEEVRSTIAPAIADFNNSIASHWIPNRRVFFLNHLQQAGFLNSSNAPAFNQFGGRVPDGFLLSITSLQGSIFITTNGTDPRLQFTGQLAPGAFAYSQPVPLNQSLQVNARTRDASGNWSALTQADFLVASPASPLRISEIMYHPPGGDAFEFIEILNLAPHPVDLSGFSLEGITYRFPAGGPALAPNNRIILASNLDPGAFATRYPAIIVSGYFNGSLSNGGENLGILDPSGRRITTVNYSDSSPWPAEPDGQGSSLELIDPQGDCNDPANWRASNSSLGSPGQSGSPAPTPTVRFNEIFTTDNPAAADWIEILNTGTNTADLAGWTLRNPADNQSFTFPPNTPLSGGSFLLITCDTNTAPGLHSGFRLNTRGESLALHSPSGSRIDVVTFGSQAPGFSIGLLPSSPGWQLTELTPGSPNEPAALAPPSALSLNEVLPNPLPDQDDWIEIHNTHPTLPASLKDHLISVGASTAQIHSLTVVGPGGFLLLRADNSALPDHLDLRLPASGATVTLLDPSGSTLSSFTFPILAENVSFGRLPDASANLTPFPSSPTPAASNYLPSWSGPILNEFLARTPASSGDGYSPASDWIELRHPNAALFNLSGLSLRADSDAWTFPPNTVLAAGGHLVIYCNSSLPASTNSSLPLNTGWNLDADGGTITLLDSSGRLADSISYGAQVPNQSVGLHSGTWHLLPPSPGRPNNAPLPLGSVSSLKFNEWMANPTTGDDWFEILNNSTLPVDMSGLLITDDLSLSGINKFVVPPRTYIPPRGFSLWTADGDATQPGHTTCKLDAQGGHLRLSDASSNILHSLTLSSQQAGTSEGTFPNGSTNLARFPTTASPGTANHLPLQHAALSEILTHTDDPLEDAIELQNLTPTSLDISGWWLSDSIDNPQRWQIPHGTLLPPNGYRVLYEFQFNQNPGASNSFELDSAHGGTLILSATQPDGTLSGYRDSFPYRAAPNAVSLGRIPTSTGTDFSPLSSRTFGADNPTSLALFRSGTGLLNSPPAVGPIIITEIMFHPASGPTNDLNEIPDEEYLEIHNPTSAPVPLFDPLIPANTWRIRDGIDITLPTGITLNPGATWLLVRFNPLADPATLSAFRSRYNLSTNTPIIGPFSGRLGNDGDSLTLERPDSPQGPGRPDAGFVPYLQVDRVHYAITPPWPAHAGGAGLSLQRSSPLLYGNEALNWKAASPTPGTVPSPEMDADRDRDGLPNGWETAHSLNPDQPSDASSDADDDGLTALQEYLLGTDPRDPTSSLTLAIQATADEYLLRFVAQPHRTFTLEYSDDPTTGDWTKVVDVPAGSEAELIEVHLTRIAQPAPRYFRLVSPARF